MKTSLLNALILTFALTSSAWANGTSLVEFLSTPAGKYLIAELRLAEAGTGGFGRASLELQSKIARIEERYMKNFGTQDGAFTAGNTSALTESKQAVLKMIAAEELSRATNFVELANSRFRAVQEAFLGGETTTYRTIGTFQG